MYSCVFDGARASIVKTIFAPKRIIRRPTMARRRIIAGNWKMNMTPSEAVKLVAELKDLVNNDAVDVVYCVPAIDIVPVGHAVGD